MIPKIIEPRRGAGSQRIGPSCLRPFGALGWLGGLVPGAEAPGYMPTPLRGWLNTDQGNSDVNATGMLANTDPLGRNPSIQIRAIRTTATRRQWNAPRCRNPSIQI